MFRKLLVLANGLVAVGLGLAMIGASRSGVSLDQTGIAMELEGARGGGRRQESQRRPDAQAEPIEITGPAEIGMTARAFNAMQTRIGRHGTALSDDGGAYRRKMIAWWPR